VSSRIRKTDDRGLEAVVVVVEEVLVARGWGGVVVVVVVEERFGVEINQRINGKRREAVTSGVT
jgi:hypothetical protein